MGKVRAKGLYTLGVAGGVFAEVQADGDKIGQGLRVFGVLFISILQQLLRLLPVALFQQRNAHSSSSPT